MAKILQLFILRQKVKKKWLNPSIPYYTKPQIKESFVKLQIISLCLLKPCELIHSQNHTEVLLIKAKVYVCRSTRNSPYPYKNPSSWLSNMQQALTNAVDNLRMAKSVRADMKVISFPFLDSFLISTYAPVMQSARPSGTTGCFFLQRAM